MVKKLQTKDNLRTRLKTYAASSGALLAIGTVVHGQVIHSGEQNVLIDNPLSPYELDMDGNSTTDFMLGVILSSTYLNSYSSYRSAFIANPATGSYVNSWLVSSIYVYSSGTTYGEVKALDVGDPINSALSYYSYWAHGGSSWNLGDIYSTDSYAYDNFPGEGNKYIGVYFHIGSDMHYGWIQVNIPEDVTQISIIDWAYESTPDTEILAGDVGVPQALLTPENAEITNVQTNTVTIKFNQEIQDLALEDFVVTNGTAANLTEVTAGIEYTIEVTATAEGEVTVELPAGAVTNVGAEDNLQATVSWEYDVTAPVATLNADATTEESTATVTISFSEEITGLEAGDFSVTNGTADNLTEVTEGTEFTVDITASSGGEVTVELPAGAVSDMAGNENAIASISYTYSAGTTGLETHSEADIKLYPVPANDYIRVELANEATIHITDLNGRLILTREHVLNETIGLERMTSGLYLMHIETEQGIEVRKFSIE